MDATAYVAEERGESTSPDLRTANTTAEEYWADIEGLEHRDTVTDFGSARWDFLRLRAVVQSADHGYSRSATGAVSTRDASRFGDFAQISWSRPRTARRTWWRTPWIGQILAIGDAVRLSITGSVRPLRDDHAPPGRSPAGYRYPAHCGPAQPGQRWGLCLCVAGWQGLAVVIPSDCSRPRLAAVLVGNRARPTQSLFHTKAGQSRTQLTHKEIQNARSRAVLSTIDLVASIASLRW